ncbi:hypothetical protein MHYP_G00352510 [Metynnis hypsauchen]
MSRLSHGGKGRTGRINKDYQNIPQHNKQQLTITANKHSYFNTLCCRTATYTPTHILR